MELHAFLASYYIYIFITIIVKSVGKVSTFDLYFASLPHPPFSILYKTELFELKRGVGGYLGEEKLFLLNINRSCVNAALVIRTVQLHNLPNYFCP